MTKVTKEELQENSFACRECKRYWSEESGAEEGFLCENCGRECPSCNEIVSIKRNGEDGNCRDCIKELRQNAKDACIDAVLENIYRSRNPNCLFSAIEIKDKIEAVVYCLGQFKKMKREYIDCGYKDESYEGFLVQTYVSTKESFPETIKEEIEEYKKELEK